MQPELYCAELSLAAAEPLHGTAAEAEHWLILEHDAPWGAKGVEDSQLPHEVLAHLSTLSAEVSSLRVQLARRPDRPPASGRAWLATVSEHAEAMWELTAPDLIGLTALDLRKLIAGHAIEGARRLTEPYFFVCVHGKRDRCCAQRGMPLYSELSSLAPERTFITTHLGGHRFAATMVVLPHGVCYGRVAPTSARAIVESHATRAIFDLERMRGRTGYESHAQAADILIRKALDERTLDALRFVRSEPAQGGERVTFVHVATGQEHSRLVTSEAMGPLMQSCGAQAKPAHRLVVQD
jgi:hypothetical protein